DEREGRDADVSAEGSGEAGENRYVVCNQRGTDLVQAHAAIFFRNVDGRETQVGGLAHEAGQDSRLLGLDGRNRRLNLFARKPGGGCRNLALLLVQVLGGKDLSRGA